MFALETYPSDNLTTVEECIPLLRLTIADDDYTEGNEVHYGAYLAQCMAIERGIGH